MASNTRYDKLREVLRQDFTDSRTFTPALDAGERELILNLPDPAFIGNDSFFEKGPFNRVIVRNLSNQDIELAFDADENTVFRVPAAAGTEVPALDAIPRRYVGFLTVTNLSGTDPIAEGDLELHIGNEVDSLELDLLKMSGLLNIRE